ncbi:pyridoxal phosphate-dependent aminotransferase [Paenibacillus pabuli]|uniref:pyridoxal phosphate-dependent aminotransferase n=1 Tax=Paenibacillus pabuli TaxID=1472 RepID=UPI001FFF8AC8|nr:pyridoxal phosphate-dependent aminotransferase [Paenibacillus pabuli]UPK41344.1 pyridoxal phosphate-dependent aminotransferase [Paenibacillus pabuli]
MNDQLSHRARTLNPYIGAELRDKVETLRRSGRKLIALNVGEPDFPTPVHIAHAGIEAIIKGVTKYTPVQGTHDVRQAVCDKLKRDNDLSYSPEGVVITSGAKQAVANALLAICNEGDEVLLPIPCWGSYPEMIAYAGAVPVFVETEPEQDFQLNVERLAGKITSKTRAILLTNPNNPTGTVLDQETLYAIGMIAVRHDLYIISDEIYEYLNYGEKVPSIAALSEEIKARTITINGLSKAYAMTGWRIGYACGPLPVIRAMTVLQSYTTSNPSSIGQYAAIAALKDEGDSVDEMTKSFDERRQYLIREIRSMEGLACPDARGAFYLMVDVSHYFGSVYEKGTISSSKDFAEYLLDQAGVVVTPGDMFQAPRFIRLSYATSMVQLQEAVALIRSALSSLQRSEHG